MQNNIADVFLSEEDVLELIHKNENFRQYLDQDELMTDDEFLKHYRTIVGKPGKCWIMGGEAGKLLRTFAVWQGIFPREILEEDPPKHYPPSTVRLMVNENRLKKLSKDEVRAILGSPLPRVNVFDVRDILCVNLGRWPAKNRIGYGIQKPKRKLGRPKGSSQKKRVAPTGVTIS